MQRSCPDTTPLQNDAFVAGIFGAEVKNILQSYRNSYKRYCCLPNPSQEILCLFSSIRDNKLCSGFGGSATFFDVLRCDHVCVSGTKFRNLLVPE